MRKRISLLSLAFGFVLTFSSGGSAQTTETLLRYKFTDTTVLPVVLDEGGAGNHATAAPLAALSTDVPHARGGFGNRSLDASAGTSSSRSGVNTDGVSLLHNDSITANGGFTYECWFRWDGEVGSGIDVLIDYAGTEKLYVRQDGIVEMHIGDLLFEQYTVQLGTAVVGQWHYAAVVFDTQGAPLDGVDSQTGIMTTYFDSGVPTGPAVPMTLFNYGDTLARPLAIGMHPTNNSEYFNGRIFEPRVTLGPVPVEQLMIFDSVLGVGMKLNGGASVVGDVLEVTPCCDFGVAGSAFIGTPFDMGMNSLEIAFSYVMTPFIGAADGITLTIQNSAAGACALGESFHFLGYGGIGAIENSVAIEFDCWANTFDPTGYGQGFDHIGYNVGGDVEAGVGVLTAPLELNDGTLRYVWINYDAALETLDVYFSDADVKPAAPLLSQGGVDLETLVGPTGFIGFTASTGGSAQSHEIHSLSIDIVTGTPYVRSDCNGDGSTNIADAINMLGVLFSGVQADCTDACDANASGSFNIADPIAFLGFLFSNGPAPDAPFPDCGIGENLGCDSYSSCP